jgi:hypothetical protein
MPTAAIPNAAMPSAISLMPEVFRSEPPRCGSFSGELFSDVAIARHAASNLARAGSAYNREGTHLPTKITHRRGLRAGLLILVVVALDVAACSTSSFRSVSLMTMTTTARTATAKKTTATTMEEGSVLIDGRPRRRNGSFLCLQPALSRFSCQPFGLQTRAVFMEGFLRSFVICHCLRGSDLPGRIPKFKLSARPASSFLLDHDSRLPRSLFGNNIKDLGRFRLSVRRGAPQAHFRSLKGWRSLYRLPS